MNLDERFGELRSTMHSLRGVARWHAAAKLITRWPDEHLREVIIPYLGGLFARDEATPRLAPDPWWELSWHFKCKFVAKHPALSLATGVRWQPKSLQHGSDELTLLHDANLTCHRLTWNESWADCLTLLDSANLTRLNALDLVSLNASLRAAGAATLAQSHHLHNLTALDLNNNRIGPQGAAALARSPHLPNLTQLKLKFNRLGDEGVAALAPLLPNLTLLDLNRNTIGDEGAITLAQSPHLHNLTHLILFGNAIGDRGAIAIAQSPPPKLTHLDLMSNEIGDAGAIAIAQSPQLASLLDLQLTRNHLSAKGRAALASSPYLHETIRAQWRR